MDIVKLADDIIAGSRLGRNDDLSFFEDCDLEMLCQGADKIRIHFCGNKVDMCTIINGKSGRCGEDCKFCAQSGHCHTDCQEYGFLDQDKIVAEAKSNEAEGVNRFSIVTSGRALTGKDFDSAVLAYKRMHDELKINLCASHGFLTRDQFRQLKQAGVSNYHHNIETSERNFPNICTTHTYQMKIDTIRIAQEEGLNVCSGGIIGMGETFQDRIDMAVSLSELNIQSIPLNALMPIPGTPYQDNAPLSKEEILRTVAMFRYVNPAAHIRLAAGRKLITENGKKAFSSGASAMITGNMLTTTGSTIQGDKKMLKEMGRDSDPVYRR